jgi:hypothetical protein
MKADLTRDTFDPTNHFSRVLMQQGRVTLDADHNEQVAILLHYLRTMARDLIGPYAAPIVDGGFNVNVLDAKKGTLSISRGRYYVDGILVENDEDCPYTSQPGPLPAEDGLFTSIANSDKKNQAFWVYLDVWERHVTPIEDDAIREKALGGVDTCTRTKVTWQVRSLPLKEVGSAAAGAPDLPTRCGAPLAGLPAVSKAFLTARVDPGQTTDDACVTPPDSKYRGTENQLYRVEIHRRGTVTDATFKWSRENGSVAAAWINTAGSDLLVSHARGFAAGDWVELSDDKNEWQGKPGVLVKLANVEGDTLSVDPGTVPTPSPLVPPDPLAHPKVRRWDQTANGEIVLDQGAVPVKEGSAGTDSWIDLENGVQIAFSPAGDYRTGDYWLIPARVATGKIEWPSSEKDHKTVWEPLPPHGVVHHYAPLGFATWKDESFKFEPCGCAFGPLSSCFKAVASGTIEVKPLPIPPVPKLKTRTARGTVPKKKRRMG